MENSATTRPYSSHTTDSSILQCAKSDSTVQKRIKYTCNANNFEERRSAANTMERRRMERLNVALDRLREMIPSSSQKRISKIKTLKLAIAYIEYLQRVLLTSEKDYWNNPNYMYYPRQKDYFDNEHEDFEANYCRRFKHTHSELE